MPEGLTAAGATDAEFDAEFETLALPDCEPLALILTVGVGETDSVDETETVSLVLADRLSDTVADSVTVGLDEAVSSEPKPAKTTVVGTTESMALLYSSRPQHARDALVNTAHTWEPPIPKVTTEFGSDNP